MGVCFWFCFRFDLYGLSLSDFNVMFGLAGWSTVFVVALCFAGFAGFSDTAI